MRHQKSVALGLCALLLAAERMERVAEGCASDEAEIGASTTKLLSHAASVRAACEAGQGVDAARAAVGGWQTKAGRASLSSMSVTGETIFDEPRLVEVSRIAE